jgi:predicted RecB family nuclease
MRVYVKNGVQYPSVTSVLEVVRQPQLERWRGRVGNEEADRIAKEAADIGTGIHNLCAQADTVFMTTGKVSLSIFDYAPKPVVSYVNWLNTYVEEIYLSEATLFSEQYRFAGTVDLVAKLKGDKTYGVFDKKTTKRIWPQMGMQLGGYRQALKETTGLVADKLAIIHMNPVTGRLKVDDDFPNPDNDFEAFLAALKLYYYMGFAQQEPDDVVYIS